MAFPIATLEFHVVIGIHSPGSAVRQLLALILVQVLLAPFERSLAAELGHVIPLRHIGLFLARRALVEYLLLPVDLPLLLKRFAHLVEALHIYQYILKIKL